MISRRQVLIDAYDVWRTRRRSPATWVARRQSRLKVLLDFTRTHSEFYKDLYRDIPQGTHNLQQLPPVTKRDLMERFNEWVTVSTITLDSARAFVADKSLIGQPYLGQYAIWTTSGVTGEPGIFIHDGDALAVYIALLMMRGYGSWLTPLHLWQLLRRRIRIATVVATGGHYASTAVRAIARGIQPRSPGHSPVFSVLTPLPELMQALDEFQPAIVASYPTVMKVLADKQVKGRLKIHPAFIATGGEWLSPSARESIATAFNCPVRDAYAASEFMGIAFDCSYGRLHVNADWVILEPVDSAYRPVPPGQASNTVLLTNLANRVQPLIRYDLGDSATMSSERCPCGNPLPSILVEGRRDEILPFPTPDGSVIQLVPMAIAAVVEETPDVQRYQVIQTAPSTLHVRLSVATGVDVHRVWEAVANRLRNFLVSQGLPSIEVKLDPESPKSEPLSGKFRQVWSDLGANSSPSF